MEVCSHYNKYKFVIVIFNLKKRDPKVTDTSVLPQRCLKDELEKTVKNIISEV